MPLFPFRAALGGMFGAARPLAGAFGVNPAYGAVAPWFGGGGPQAGGFGPTAMEGALGVGQQLAPGGTLAKPGTPAAQTTGGVVDPAVIAAQAPWSPMWYPAMSPWGGGFGGWGQGLTPLGQFAQGGGWPQQPNSYLNYLAGRRPQF
jgi:hypothetical protein